MTTQLNPVDGIPVVNTAIAITGAGDGLSKALRTAKRELHPGETVHVVIETTVDQITFKPAEKDEYGEMTRIHRLKAGLATIVDADFAEAVLESQKLANEELEGIQRIPFEPDNEDES